MNIEEKLKREIIKKTEEGIIVWQKGNDVQSQYEACCGDMRLVVTSFWDGFTYGGNTLEISDKKGKTVFCQKSMASAPIAQLFRAIDGFCKREPEETKESIQEPDWERLPKKLLKLLK